MNTNPSHLAITEDGQVYRLRDHDRPLLLGQISSLVREESPQGREVRAWWLARLAAEEPGENIVVTPKGEFYFVPCPEAVGVTGSQPEPAGDLIEAKLVAD